MTDTTSVGKPVNGGPSAPRLTLADIESKIIKTHFHLVPDTTTTVCTLVLLNGFTVTGTSACVSQANFDKEIGEQIAYEQALEKVWELEGYLLKEKLVQKGDTPEDRVAVELSELALRLGSLNTLLKKPRPAFISSVQWALMHGQKKAMELYSKILLKRLALFARGE